MASQVMIGAIMVRTHGQQVSSVGMLTFDVHCDLEYLRLQAPREHMRTRKTGAVGRAVGGEQASAANRVNRRYQLRKFARSI